MSSSGSCWLGGRGGGGTLGSRVSETLSLSSSRFMARASRCWRRICSWRALAVPVIAAVHGVAFGGGLQIMSGACVRIAHPATRFAIRELHWHSIAEWVYVLAVCNRSFSSRTSLTDPFIHVGRDTNLRRRSEGEELLRDCRKFDVLFYACLSHLSPENR